MAESLAQDLDLETVTTKEQFAEHLRTVHLQAGRPSLRVLEARAREAKVGLSRSTASTMLSGRRFPKMDVLIAFLEACESPPDQIEAWKATWLRVCDREQDHVLDSGAARGSSLVPSDEAPSALSRLALDQSGAATPMVSASLPLVRPDFARPTMLLGGLGCALSVLTVGGMLAGAAGLTISAIFCLLVIPVLNFTRSQLTLASKAGDLSQTAEDARLRLLKVGMWAHPRPLPGPAGPTGGGWRPPPAATFWDVLSAGERDELGRLASTVTFAPGDVVFHEGEPAAHVLLLRSGQVKICLHRADGERILALRGPGDLVGERGALEVGRRAATVEALDTVHAWVLRTDVFRAFLERHPRVVGLIEDQIYGRLTEENPATPASPVQPEYGHERTSPGWTGQNCTIIYTDIASSSARPRSDEDRRVIRRVMYELVQQACEESGVPWFDCHREDRGDGMLIVIPPSTPTSCAIDPFLARMATGLRRHNRLASDVLRMQVRLAVNVGPVVSDTSGVTGHAIIHTARLLDSPVLKAELKRTGADLGFITSPFVYEGIIRHNRSLWPDTSDLRQVSFKIKETATTAWMWIASDSMT